MDSTGGGTGFDNVKGRDAGAAPQSKGPPHASPARWTGASEAMRRDSAPEKGSLASMKGGRASMRAASIITTNASALPRGARARVGKPRRR